MKSKQKLDFPNQTKEFIKTLENRYANLRNGNQKLDRSTIMRSSQMSVNQLKTNLFHNSNKQ